MARVPISLAKHPNPGGSPMACAAKRLPTNVPGAFFVDASCIDCGTCRWLAPLSFGAAGDAARVKLQPERADEVAAALLALVACPVGAIGGPGGRLAEARAAFPRRLDGPVHHCGWHARASFGASSWLIVRPEGNVMVDSPRFSAPLVRRIEQLGGIRLMVLTHRDDVADHHRFHQHFGCDRLLHADDVGPATAAVEIQPSGREPIRLAPDLELIPVPGHTRGSVCLLHRDTHLFSGDHLAWSPGVRQLVAFRDATWYDWRELVASMERLAGHRFTWVLPGHGAPVRLPPAEMAASMRRLCAKLRETA